MRLRSVQASRGVAQPRGTVTPRPNRPVTLWDPWYPYYGYRPSYYFGAGLYDPWLYGSGAWAWNRYAWHDPFLFDPFGYPGYGPYYWPSARVEREERAPGIATGSIRLRVNPAHARVYIDGALAGVAGEFGGLTNHLELPAGIHQLELRADGFTTYSGDVDVRENRTRTERINLKEE